MIWLSWEEMRLSKSKAGMGFKYMHAFNQACLAKQARCLIETPHSLCAHLLRPKYYPNGDILDTVFLGSSSAIRKDIVHGLEFKKGLYGETGLVFGPHVP